MQFHLFHFSGDSFLPFTWKSQWHPSMTPITMLSLPKSFMGARTHNDIEFPDSSKSSTKDWFNLARYLFYVKKTLSNESRAWKWCTICQTSDAKMMAGQSGSDKLNLSWLSSIRQEENIDQWIVYMKETDFKRVVFNLSSLNSNT